MQTKAGQRVALYEVTALSAEAPSSITVGMILVDRPRGESTTWEFIHDAGKTSSVTGTRLGFARVNADGKTYSPEPALQTKLDALKAAA